MKASTIFISYNPSQPDEQTLAIRLHTIGAANGFRMFLPDRFNSNRVLDKETRFRIDQSDYFILFSLTEILSPIVQDEIDYAWKRFKDKSKIIVIYRAYNSKSLHPGASQHCTEIYFDPVHETMDLINKKILDSIFHKQNQFQNNEEVQNGLMAFLGIGLGLLALYALAKE